MPAYLNIHLGVLVAYGSLRDIVCISVDFSAVARLVQDTVEQPLEWHEETFIYTSGRRSLPYGRVASVHRAVLVPSIDPQRKLITDALIVTYALRLPDDIQTFELSDDEPMSEHLTGFEPRIGGDRKHGHRALGR